MLKIAYNTTDQSVLVDELGFTIGGRSWGVVDTTDPLGKAELDSGRIFLADEATLRGATDNPAAQAAVAALDERVARLEAAQGADKDDLIEALPPETVESLDVGGDGKPTKDDLVDAAVADPEADITTSTTAKKKTTSRTRGQ